MRPQRFSSRRPRLFVISCLVVFGLVPAAAAADQPVKLTFWHLWGGGDAPYAQQVVDAFNEAYRGRIEVEMAEIPAFYERFDVAVAGGTPPDIAVIHARYIGKYGSMGVLHDIAQLAAELGVPIDPADYIPPAWAAGTYEGAQIAVPIDIIMSLLLFYNKDLFEQAGLDAHRPPEDADSFMEAVYALRGLTAEGKEFWPTWIEGGYGTYRTFFSLLHQAGGTLLKDSRDEAAFHERAGIEAIQFLRGLVENEFVLWPPNNMVSRFASNQIGLVHLGGWNIAYLDQFADLDYGVAMIPRFFNDRSFFANSHMFALPKAPGDTPEKLKAALEFIRFWGPHSLSWAQAGHLPVHLDVAQSREFHDLPHHGAHLAQAPFAVYPPAIPEIARVESLVEQTIHRMLNGEAAPEPALAEAARQIDALLQEQ